MTELPDYFFRTFDLVKGMVGDEVSVHGEVFSPFTHYLELFGYESPDDIAGLPVMDLVAADDRTKFKDYMRTHTKGGREAVEIQVTGLRADGDEFARLRRLGPLCRRTSPRDREE